MYTKTIDAGKCTSCMKCRNICTNSQVIVKNEDGLPEFRYDSKCIYCGHCLSVCPEDAITFTPLPGVCEQEGVYCAETTQRNAGANPLSADAAFDFLCGTRSNRLFLSQPVEREKIDAVVDAMVRAPSAGNEQNRNYYVISNPDALAKLEQAIAAHYEKSLKALRRPASRAMVAFFGALRAGKANMGTLETTKMPLAKRYRLMQTILKDAVPTADSTISYLKQAPALILITRGPKDSSIHRDFYRSDAGIAATYGILMAKALGLASCWMGLLMIAFSQNAKLGPQIKLKPGERVDAAIVLGYSNVVWNRIPPRGPANVTWLS